MCANRKVQRSSRDSRHSVATGIDVPASVTPARWVAFRVVLRTFVDGAFTDRALQSELTTVPLDERDRAFAQRLAYGTVRAAKRYDYIIATIGRRALTKLDPEVLACLRLGCHQLLAMDAVPDHAAINETIETVRAACGERPTPFANAVLRRAQVDARDLLAKLDPRDSGDLATLLSMPEWIVQHLRDEYGDEGIAALKSQSAADDRATYVRINTLKASEEQADLAAQASVHTRNERDTSTSKQAWTMADPLDGAYSAACTQLRQLLLPTSRLNRLFAAGSIVAQSPAAMLAAPLLNPQPGTTIADLCAAPGGKTTHIAQLAGASSRLVACELHPHRARSLTGLLKRCGVANCRVVCGDARTIELGDGEGSFDAALVDAPCSGLGVLAARPDARWHHTAGDIADVCTIQQGLLTRAARLVRPGGVVVYSTCTLSRRENEGMVQWALSQGILEPAELPAWAAPFAATEPNDPPSTLRLWPQHHHSDGFFYARLRRPAH